MQVRCVKMPASVLGCAVAPASPDPLHTSRPPLPPPSPTNQSISGIIGCDVSSYSPPTTLLPPLYPPPPHTHTSPPLPPTPTGAKRGSRASKPTPAEMWARGGGGAQAVPLDMKLLWRGLLGAAGGDLTVRLLGEREGEGGRGVGGEGGSKWGGKGGGMVECSWLGKRRRAKWRWGEEGSQHPFCKHLRVGSRVQHRASPLSPCPSSLIYTTPTPPCCTRSPPLPRLPPCPLQHQIFHELVGECSTEVPSPPPPAPLPLIRTNPTSMYQPHSLPLPLPSPPPSNRSSMSWWGSAPQARRAACWRRPSPVLHPPASVPWRGTPCGWPRWRVGCRSTWGSARG
jgi:hypothetical protein